MIVIAVCFEFLLLLIAVVYPLVCLKKCYDMGILLFYSY